MKDEDPLGMFVGFSMLIFSAMIGGLAERLYTNYVLKKLSIEAIDVAPAWVRITAKIVLVLAFVATFVTVILIGFAIEEVVTS